VVAGEISMLGVEFNKNVVSDGTADAANFVGNYLLVEDGTDNVFQTVSCFGGASLTDSLILINAVTYSNNAGSGPFAATLMVNNGTPLPIGRYRLFVCGTTTITDPLGNELNNGESDTTITFLVAEEPPEPPTPPENPDVIPVTGFAPGQLTALANQPLELAYADLGDLWLEIPRLGVQIPIVGVPQEDGSWDVSWLANQAGYLEGSAFPTWTGNSVITAHVYDANGKAGPFVNLGNLLWGNQIIVHAYGKQYVYEVRSVTQVRPDEVSKMMKHETLSWLTLVTCKGYNESTGGYQYRILVRAVLVKVK
jgi:LPXTG-site transpeptidase (sortase) family protein